MYFWYIPFVTKKERPENKGYSQSVMLQVSYVGVFLSQIVVLLCFSDPTYTCIGYEKDPSVPCTTVKDILSQNPLSQDDPDNWCYKCTSLFTFDASLRQVYACIVGIVILLTLPSIVFLKKGEILAIATIWCISIPACVIYWPILAKKEKFDWKVFI